MPSFNVKDSIAFVTGTNKPNGIGRAIVEALLSNGAAKVYATARDASQLEDLVAAHPHGKVVAVALDVTDLKAVAALSTVYPDVTIVVNNAGYAASSGTLSIDDAVAEIQINYIAPLAIGKSFASNFAKLDSNDNNDTKPSALVNLCSIASFINFPGVGSYSASKAATHSLTQAQRRDLGNSLVIGIYPGPIETDMSKHVPMEKVSPAVVADAIMDALKTGSEDIFPDPAAQQMYEGYKADAKAMENNMAAAAASSKH